MGVQEQVLVIPRKVLDGIGLVDGLIFEIEPYFQRIFSPGALRYMPRDKAERDPTCKQLIPYVLMVYGGRFLNYVRGKRAGESRLVGQRSIGIGGHINPIDDMSLLGEDFRETYLAAVAREVAEEVAVETSYTDRAVALLNDDSNEVGRVHIGIVHLWRLAAPRVSRREQMITQMGFDSAEDLLQDASSLETWSALCLAQADALAQRAAAMTACPVRCGDSAGAGA